jgi:transaldolase
MPNNPLLEIKNYGQSIWMDNLTRDLIHTGELQRLIEERGIRGITTNPAIFAKAISGSQRYDADIEAGIRANKPIEEIYESLIFEDIRQACDILRPIYDESDGLDGYVSIEVRPTIAHDTQATIEDARRYYQQIGRDNVMIKIPGTLSGFEAIAQVIEDGISVNVTLLFAVENYLAAADAYMKGLEARVQKNQDIRKIASVASFFLSRIDVNVDSVIDEKLKTVGTDGLQISAQLEAVKGKVAIANAKLAYEKYQEMIRSDRWQALKAKGASPQRLLWASTSTKNPKYSDVMYVDSLIGADTVNTLPPETIEACADHCNVDNRLMADLDKAHTLIDNLKDPNINVDLDQVMAQVLDEGIDKFIQPYQTVIQSLENKVNQLETSS